MSTRISRNAFHALLKAEGLEFSAQNVDGMGTPLSSDYTDIRLRVQDVPKLEQICEREDRSCIWPVVGTYDSNYTIRRVTLYAKKGEQ